MIINILTINGINFFKLIRIYEKIFYYLQIIDNNISLILIFFYSLGSLYFHLEKKKNCYLF